MKKLIEFFAVLLLLSNTLLSTQSVKAQCHIDDWTAIQAFVKSTKGSILDDLTWVPYSIFDTTLIAPYPNCNLSPYFILDDQGRVSEFGFAGAGTSGYIPSEIGLLTNLKTLFMNSYPGFGLTGAIPAELGNLTKLQSLDLIENGLEGCFDKNLRSLCNQLTTVRVNEPDHGSISNNNFEASWDDFCATGAGECKEFSVVKAQPEIETEEGDVYIKESLHGVILRSENGLCFRITVKNDGTLVTNNVRCP